MAHDTESLTDSVATVARAPIAGSARRRGALSLWAESTADGTPRLALAAERPADLAPFAGEATVQAGLHVLRGPLAGANLAALRAALPNLAPVPLALATTAGFGDRLGLAT
ncbi:MAG: hypothetical protein ACNA8N_09835, partial [Trueperaceae bacterium]